MPEQSKTFAFGTLSATSDTWILNAGNQIILLDLGEFDLTLENKRVSVIGKMGIPATAPGILKLIVEKLVGHEEIAKRAFELFRTGAAGTSKDHWFQAESELLRIK